MDRKAHPLTLTSSTLKSPPTAAAAGPANPNFCQGCRSMVSFAQKFNSTNKRDDFKELFRNYCEIYYPASTDFQQGPCPLFVQGLFYVLDHTDPINHCDQIGACGPVLPTNGPVSVDNTLTSRGANIICEFCEQTVEQVQTALSDPKAIDQVRRQVDAFCDYLKVIEQDKQCKQMVNKYLDQFLSFVHHINPLDYCKSVQLCPANKRRFNLLPTLADFNNFGIETSALVGPSAPAALRRQESPRSRTVSPTHHREGPACALCKTIIKELFQFVRDNRTEANIILGLNKVCEVIYNPGENRDQCESMVKAYTKEIIQLMIEETDPEMICMLLEQCVYEKDEVSPKRIADPAKEAPRASVDAATTNNFGLGELITALDSSIEPLSLKACIECKVFIRYLRESLEDPKSQDYIRLWLLENLCAEMPDNEVQKSCDRMVQQYSDVFFKAVAGSLNPRKACVNLGVCHPQSLSQILIVDNSLSNPMSQLELRQPALRPVQPKRKPSSSSTASLLVSQVKGQLCDQCVEVVSQIDEYLSNHPIDQDVSKLIDNVCNKMPEGAVRYECVFMVKTFGAEIAQAVATMDNPRQVCTQIMLC